MKKLVSRVGMAMSMLAVAIMLWLYIAVEQGTFESEPIGVLELRAQKESGEHAWLHGQVAWLRLDGTHIDYPVMQANDNKWYLSHDYYGNNVASGAVFLDFRNSPDFSGSLSIIYGHRMNSDLMFSDVAKYRDASFFSAHPTGTLELPNRTIPLRVLAYREVNADDELYRSMKLQGYDLPVLILSTCNRADHGRRDILVLAFDNRGELW